MMTPATAGTRMIGRAVRWRSVTLGRARRAAEGRAADFRRRPVLASRRRNGRAVALRVARGFAARAGRSLRAGLRRAVFRPRVLAALFLAAALAAVFRAA